MALGARKVVDAQLKEALISMTTLTYIEEHALLTQAQLEDAKQSLQALFLRTSGEETMLRRLIAILKTTRSINKAFSDISKILNGVSRGAATVDAKLTSLRQDLEHLKITAEENTDLCGPFLSFSSEFLKRVGALRGGMEKYITARENEARCANVHRIALDARQQLKQRLSGSLGARARGEIEAKIKQEVQQTFDYGEAEKNLKGAKQQSRRIGSEINDVLGELREMCQMAMNPDMRDRGGNRGNTGEPRFPDVFMLARAGLKKHPRLQRIKENLLNLFKLYQHSYGMLSLDFENLNRAIGPMITNSDAYFRSKEEDEDIRVKREKLQKIEALIPFVERTAEALLDKEARTYPKFSKRFSEIISNKKTPWDTISSDLLRMKVMAEAELSARM
ncbi:MAG: hypothetical protein ACE5LB_06865 [Acidiferrobacterales bacterium]